MPKDSPIPLPDDAALLQWVMQNPDALVRAVQAINLLLALQIKFIRAGIATLNQQGSLVIGEQEISSNLPILWANGIPPDLAAGASAADIRLVVNLMLAGERSWQNLPGTPT